MKAIFFFSLVALLMNSAHVMARSSDADEIDLKNFPMVRKPVAVLKEPLEKLPLPVLEILKKHPRWQTTSLLVSPDFSPMPSGNRTWVLKISNSSILLSEKTQLSLVQDCSTRQYVRWTSAEIDISQIFNTRDFFLGGRIDQCDQPKIDRFNIVFLDEDRFVVEPIGTGVGVLFFPVGASAPRKPKTLLASANVVTAPLGYVKSFGGTVPGFKTFDYLHHDLKNPMPVFVDKSFPDQFIPSIEKALLNWNEALGVNFFQLKNQKSDLDPYDCFSTRKFCVFWSGPEGLSFLGVGGKSHFVFDPESGQIGGGYLGILNNVGQTLGDAPAYPELERYLTEKASIEDIARLFNEKKELIHFKNSKNSWYLDSVISHEIGHYNGLSHNFYGSLAADETGKTFSIMDYIPFSAVGSKGAQLKSFDTQMLDLIYQDKAPARNYRYCSDFDSSPDFVSVDPNCNQWDVGRPDSWFVLRSQLAKEGVFAPERKGILLDFLAPYLDSKKPTVAPEQTANVLNFLCNSYPSDQKVKDHLMNNYAIDLICQ